MSRQHLKTVSIFLFCHLFVGGAIAQFGDGSAPDQLGTKSLSGASSQAIQFASAKHRWQVGVKIMATGGACQNLVGAVPVPTDWPGQDVRIVEEDISREISSVRYRTLDGGVKQMLVKVGRLRSGQSAHALVVVEIDREQTPPPEHPEQLLLPDKLDRKIRKYLGTSPYIEVRHPEIRDLAKELHDESLPIWSRIEMMYDHVRDNVKYQNGQLKGALAALRDGTGDCEELTSLFIALCRANGVPARTVWVPNHCYPEFYLEDAEGNGTWFPCQAAGTRSFGTMPDMRPILQKGDNFKVPEIKDRQRYVAEFLNGATRKGNGKPQVRFVREILSSSDS